MFGDLPHGRGGSTIRPLMWGVERMLRLVVCIILTFTAILPAYADQERDFALCEKPADDPAGALAGCSRLLQSESLPNPTAVYAFRGMAKLYLKRPEEAVADFNEAINRNPNLATVFVYRAMAFEGLKDFQKAIADYDTALALQPGNSRILTRRALSRMKVDQLDEALADFAAAIEGDPSNPVNYYNRGVIYATGGRIEEALAEYESAERADPTYRPIYRARSRVYLLLNQPGNALGDLNKAIELNAKDIESKAARAWILSTSDSDTLRNGEQAIQDARDVIDVYDNPDIRDTLAAAYAETGNFERAIEEIGRARDMLIDDGQTTQVIELDARLALYKKGLPYRENSGP